METWKCRSPRGWSAVGAVLRLGSVCLSVVGSIDFGWLCDRWLDARRKRLLAGTAGGEEMKRNTKKANPVSSISSWPSLKKRLRSAWRNFFHENFFLRLHARYDARTVGAGQQPPCSGGRCQRGNSTVLPQNNGWVVRTLASGWIKLLSGSWLGPSNWGSQVLKPFEIFRGQCVEAASRERLYKTVGKAQQKKRAPVHNLRGHKKVEEWTKGNCSAEKIKTYCGRKILVSMRSSGHSSGAIKEMRKRRK